MKISKYQNLQTLASETSCLLQYRYCGKDQRIDIFSNIILLRPVVKVEYENIKKRSTSNLRD